ADAAVDARERLGTYEGQRQIGPGRGVGQRDPSDADPDAGQATSKHPAPTLPVSYRDRSPARPRAGILITGTEVLTGIISDRNGPWLSERLVELGVDTAMIQIVGDRPDDLLAALE